MHRKRTQLLLDVLNRLALKPQREFSALAQALRKTFEKTLLKALKMTLRI